MAYEHGVKLPDPAGENRTAADKRAEDKRKLAAAWREALAAPENQHVLAELAKR
jgi:hypothetical protein